MNQGKMLWSSRRAIGVGDKGGFIYEIPITGYSDEFLKLVVENCPEASLEVATALYKHLKGKKKVKRVEDWYITYQRYNTALNDRPDLMLRITVVM